jgi:serine/threonine protein kinase
MNDPPSQSFRAVQPGDILAGKYSVERVLGTGGMGVVVLATHMHLEQRVAIKFLLPEANHSLETIRRFLQEAKAAARLRGEHVVRVHDTGTLENGAPYIVMEYLEGQDLSTLVETQGPLPIRDAVDYVLQACEAIAEAHAAGIIHRDLKPANLFLNRAPDGTRSIKVLDFGISKIAPKPGSLAASAMTKTRALMGSPLYMSPEQMRSTRTVTPKADVWALGIILYELLAGGPPFAADTMPEICARVLAEPLPPVRSARPEVAPALEALLLRCTEKEPAARLDVAAMAAALAPFGSARGALSAERVARVARGGSVPPVQDPVQDKELKPNALDAIGTSQTMESNPGRLEFAGPSRPSVDSAPVLLAAHPAGTASPPVAAATVATFGSTGPQPRPLPRAVFILAGAGALVMALVTILAVVRWGAPASKSSSVSVSPSSIVATTPTASASITIALPSTSTPTPTSTLPSPLPEPASTKATPPTPAQPRQALPHTTSPIKTHPPAATPSAQPKPAPANTSGFGGLE